MSISMGSQQRRTPTNIDNTITQEETDVLQFPEQASANLAMPKLTHKHFGHFEEHPIALRHRKTSSDPLHGEEDKLIDTYKELFDLARRGECNPSQLGEIQSIRGRLSEISASRQEDARKLLAEEFESNNPDDKVRLSKALDAILMTELTNSKIDLAISDTPKPQHNQQSATVVRSSVSTFKGQGVVEQRPVDSS